jgi:cytochrome c553
MDALSSAGRKGIVVALPKKAAVLMWSASLCAAVSLCPDHVGAQSRAAPTVATVCAPCHGLDGVGHDVEIPNIGGQHSIYLRKQLLAFKNGTRKHPEMRYMARKLTDRELDELVVYYSTLPPN